MGKTQRDNARQIEKKKKKKKKYRDDRIQPAQNVILLR